MPKCEYCKRAWLEAEHCLINDVSYFMCDDCRERMKEPGQWDVMQLERSERWKTAQRVLKELGEIWEIDILKVK